MICDLDDDIWFFCTKNRPYALRTSQNTQKNALHNNHSSCGATRPNIHYRFGLLSSLATAKLRKIPTASSGSSAHNMFVVLESRVHETNVINVGWEPKCQNCGLGTGVLKTPKKGSKKGVKKGVKKGSKNPPFWDPEFVQIAQPD
jgi:hypothetical protein